jgi:ABC-type glycerol-3-phosphate transport system substrate-binding protein
VRAMASASALAAVILAAGCSGAGSGAQRPATTTSTTTRVVATTTTITAAGPCGGAPTVPAAVRASAVAGLNQNPTQYNVDNVSLARSDPTWGRFDALPVPGQEGVYQGGFGIVHCANDAWSVTDFGTSEVGCPGGSVAPPPDTVRVDLGIQCP